MDVNWDATVKQIIIGLCAEMKQWFDQPITKM